VQVIEKSAYDALEAELAKAKELIAKLQSERDRVASGKVTCEDCGAILARF
jgi:RNA polymerase-binding transcription factor DksA